MMVNEIAERIRRMEDYFDRLTAALAEGRSLDETERAMLAALADYLDSGLWLADFERDERGELPASLKRGVLSQDGLYNLLQELGEGASTSR